MPYRGIILPCLFPCGVPLGVNMWCPPCGSGGHHLARPCGQPRGPTAAAVANCGSDDCLGNMQGTTGE